MGYTLEDWIADNVPEGQENSAIYEVKLALVKQIMEHPKSEIHTLLNWVNDDTSDSYIIERLTSWNTDIYNLIFTLANLSHAN